MQYQSMGTCSSTAQVAVWKLRNIMQANFVLFPFKVCVTES